MNFAESAALEQLLRERNWEAAPDIQRCDLLIINTCSVRITAETRVFGRLGLFSALKKLHRFTIVLMGCMAERLHEQIKKDFPRIDYVVGMFERDQFESIFEAVEQKNTPHQEIVAALADAGGAHTGSAAAHLTSPESADTVDQASSCLHGDAKHKKPRYQFSERSYTEGAFQSFVPIMNGCNNFCTYCIVPYTRGREVSRSVQSILNEISFLSGKGVREITLLGQNVNSYRGTHPLSGMPVHFPHLLRAVSAACAEQDVIKWIRFISSHPKDLSDDLIDVMAQEPRVCKSLHLPIQHGSNTILARMNRYYTVEQYLTIIEKLRKKMPSIVLSTDILIGFPGETQEDFQKTLDVMREVQFDSAFMYHYNPREGTKAYSFPDRIPDAERINRLQQVIDLQQEITERRMRKRIGLQTTMLVESHSRNNPDELFGHTEQGEMVVLTEKCDPACIGHFIQVELQSIKGKTFRGKPLNV